MLLDAYYNFIGNAAMFSNKIVDNLVKKGLEFGKTAQLTPLLANHNFLYYYPAPAILTLFLVNFHS